MYQKKHPDKKTQNAPNKIVSHNTIKNKQSPVKNQIKNSSCCDADDFYLTYIYMFICATANKKNNTDDSDNTHHSKYFIVATTTTPPSDKQLTKQARTKNFHRAASHKL